MLKTSCKIFCCLTITLFAFHPTIAETRQIKLLNPDGTPAVDAKAVAIMTPGARVDANLKELPSLFSMREGSGTTVVANEGGTLKFESKALAVLAQSPSGFVFIPLPMANREVKLRPWAKLKVDLSTLTLRLSKTQRLTVIWENCFAGYPPQPKLPTQSDDPFSTPATSGDLRFDSVRPTIMTENNDPFGTPEPNIDWRFDPLVMWSLGIESTTDQVVNVPPGEVSLVLSDEDFHSATAEQFVPAARYSPVRTLSGKEATFKAPEVKTIRGQLFENSLPEWNKSSDNLIVMAHPTCEKMPEDFAKLFTQPSRARDANTMLDELARRYASDLGMRYRYELLVPMASARVNDDGSFELSNVPVGTYDLELLGSSFHAPVKLKLRGETDNKTIAIELTGKPSPLDVGQVERAETARELPKPPTTPAPPVQQPAEKDSRLGGVDEGFAINPIETAEQQIRTALLKRVDLEFQGLSFIAVIDEFSSATSAPIRLNLKKLESLQITEDTPIKMSLPRMTLHSALGNILSSLSDELTFTIRDEVLLITTKEDAAHDQPITFQNATAADVDSGDAFLTYWQKLHTSPFSDEADQVALRKALQDHLEQEFDAKQQTRRKELDRLRALLKQSEDWLNTRQQRRAEIVKKRTDELLEKAKSNRP